MHNDGAGDVFLIGANMPHQFKSDPAYFLSYSANIVEALTIF